MSVAIAEPRQLSVDDVDFYNEHGYLRLKQVFDPLELAALSEELDHIIQYFATHGKGWSGPWRKQLMQSDVETKSLLVTIHELQSYSAAWARALVQERLVQSVADIIGPELEFHHSTLHAKGPDTGTPFPMHQDYPFYPHQDGRYIDAILHVDTADETSGCLKFLEGSHKLGPLEHSREGSPHLDQNGVPPSRRRVRAGRPGRRGALQHLDDPRLRAQRAAPLAARSALRLPQPAQSPSERSGHGTPRHPGARRPPQAGKPVHRGLRQLGPSSGSATVRRLGEQLSMVTLSFLRYAGYLYVRSFQVTWRDEDA